MSTLLITGGCGFIGSHFVRHCLRERPQDKIVNYDLLTYAGNPANLADVASDPRYVFAQGDIADPASVRAVFEEHRPNCVVNFAAESHNSNAVIDPALFFRVNVLGTQTLLDAAREFGVDRFHHISTCEVFGDLPLDSPEKFTENSPYLPRTPYNASKAAADMAARAYANTYNLPVTISICANNYGSHQFPEKLIPHFVTSMLRGKNMTLYKSSRHRREWLHVADHCRAISAILDRGAVGQTYNIGSETEMDIEEVADRILALFNADASRKQYVPDRPAHDRRYLLSADKIRRELQWQPQVGLDEGFASAVEWYKNNESWWAPLLAKKRADEGAWQK
jgi:dTDP-glucose 4,6-dehydratase